MLRAPFSFPFYSLSKPTASAEQHLLNTSSDPCPEGPCTSKPVVPQLTKHRPGRKQKPHQLHHLPDAAVSALTSSPNTPWDNWREGCACAHRDIAAAKPAAPHAACLCNPSALTIPLAPLMQPILTQASNGLFRFVSSILEVLQVEYIKLPQ